MDRKKFIAGFSLLLLPGLKLFSRSKIMKPEEFIFKDDGVIPNSHLPLLIYKNAFNARGTAGAAWLEKTFGDNNWTNSWRNGIYPFHHYHSTSHEVLGIYSGNALVHLGGENGKKINIEAGDIIIIPAGVGHKNLGGSGLGVVGAYPDGRNWDVNTGKPGERPGTDKTIAALPVPSTDPLNGQNGLPGIWKSYSPK
ncbi:cupin domain-containing protein [Mucilaginibacter sp. CAU 1740]|uniref:cupin domain-containing protein n=1 Tax=Mucilaginibacter sp. CAU 1740 TaxID=3140365 RepID=UPI00325AAC7B